MKSMTGHGRGEFSAATHQITIEASSVNRKQAEWVINLPRQLDSLEPRVRELIAQGVSRGRLTLKVSLTLSDDAHARARVNRTLAKSYVQELRELAVELDVPPAFSLDTLLRLPGVFEAAEPEHDAESFWPSLKAAADTALAALIGMREKEGAHLARDLDSRIQIMRSTVAAIRSQAPEVTRKHRDQLVEKLKAAGLQGVNPDDDRLLKEIVLFADRSDIAEELARLESHFEQFNDCLKSPEPVGRTLDFLAQEMNREINTIGSKANDSLISKSVVVLKTELERFREQAQNVE